MCINPWHWFCLGKHQISFLESAYCTPPKRTDLVCVSKKSTRKVLNCSNAVSWLNWHHLYDLSDLTELLTDKEDLNGITNLELFSYHELLMLKIALYPWISQDHTLSVVLSSALGWVELLRDLMIDDLFIASQCISRNVFVCSAVKKTKPYIFYISAQMHYRTSQNSH